MRGALFKPPFPTALVPGSITVRGPGTMQRGYCFQAATATTTNPPTENLPGPLQGNTLTDARRRVELTITPAPSPRITVSMDFMDGNGPQPVVDIPAPPNPPSTYKFGWSGSTGASDRRAPASATLVVKTVMPARPAWTWRSRSTARTPWPNPLPPRVASIPYQFVVTNAGLETLTGLAITDPLVVQRHLPVDRQSIPRTAADRHGRLHRVSARRHAGRRRRRVGS